MDGLKFSVSLEDFVSTPSTRAASSLKRLETQLGASKASLASYQAQLARSNAIGDIDGHRKYQALVDTSRKSVFDLTEQVDNANTPLARMGATAGGAGVALGLVAGAALAAGAAFGAMALEIGEAAVKTSLEVTAVNERLVATFDALGSGPGAGAPTLAFLNDLSSKLPQSRDQLATWTKQFQTLGITNLDELRHQVLAVASAQAIGQEYAGPYLALTEKIHDAVAGHHQLKMGRDPLKALAESGASADAVAKKLGLTVQQLDAGLKGGTLNAQNFGNAISATLVDRGTGPLAAMGSEISTLATKATETLHHLFDGIDTSPLTDAIKSVISLGDQGTPSGQALADGVQSGTNTVIKGFAEAITESEVFFINLETYSIEAHTFLQPIIATLEEITGTAGGAAANIRGLMGAFEGAASGGFHGAVGGGALGGLVGAVGGAVGGVESSKAPAHALGGLVTQPASGERFASVKPGEMILPERMTAMLSGSGLGAAGSAAVSPAAQGGGDGGVQIGTLHLTVQGSHGVTDAKELSVAGLTVALERLRLSGGR